MLIKHCSAYFERWWDPRRFQAYPSSIEALALNCAEYMNVWLPHVLEKDSSARALVALVMQRTDEVKQILLQNTLERGGAE